jgi:hypothetical protein
MTFLLKEARRRRESELPEFVELFQEESEPEKPGTCSQVADCELDFEFFDETPNSEIDQETVTEPVTKATLTDFEVPEWSEVEEFHSESPNTDESFDEFFFS